jgi:hypothetical protein
MKTIEQMVKHFENLGFEVKKHWFEDTFSYQFTIIKDEVGAIGMYEWKRDLSPEQITTYQRNFIRRLIYLWKEQHDLRHNNKSLKDLEKQLLNSIYGKNGLVINPNYGYLTDIFVNYKDTDMTISQELLPKTNPYTNNPKIKDVIFNNPATIVFWSDGTKTVVKCQEDDIYDPEKGLAMAISKKFFGNKGNYCNEIKKWMDKYEEQTFNPFQEALDKICESVRQVKITIPKLDITTKPKTITALDKLKAEYPNEIDQEGMAMICPHVHKYLPKPDNCGWGISCEECWNREMPAEPEQNKE